ncbi:hypothetical protein Gotur_006007 [Gossypium turneri]
MEELFQYHSSSESFFISPSPSSETFSGGWDELLLNFNSLEEMVWVDMAAAALDLSNNSIGYSQTERVTQGRESLQSPEAAALAYDQEAISTRGSSATLNFPLEVVRESLPSIKYRCDEGCSPALALKRRHCLRKRSK